MCSYRAITFSRIDYADLRLPRKHEEHRRGMIKPDFVVENPLRMHGEWLDQEHASDELRVILDEMQS